MKRKEKKNVFILIKVGQIEKFRLKGNFADGNAFRLVDC
jgi:hypothetical protein